MFHKIFNNVNNSPELSCMVFISLYFGLINLTIKQDNKVHITACGCQAMIAKQ